MAVSTQSSDQRTQIIVEFKARIKCSRDEIQTRFSRFNDQLKEDELRLLTKLDDIERDTIDKFNGSSASLSEILLARENILGILKSNTTSTLLKNNLEMYDKEIEEITTKSVIKSTKIELNWKLDKLGTICEMNEIVYQNFKTTFPQPKDDSTSGSITPIVEDHFETIRPVYKTNSPMSDPTIQPKYNFLSEIDDFVIDPEHFSHWADENDYDVTDPLTTIPPWNRKWKCPNCTYCNVPFVYRCEMCTWELPK